MTPFRVVGAFAVALAMTAAVNAGPVPQDKNIIPATVGDLSKSQLIEVKDTTGQVLLHGTLKTKDNSVKETERKADLDSPTGQPSKGKIDIDLSHKVGKDLKDEIEVTVERMPTMTDCELWIDGQRVGNFVTTKRGTATIKLSRKTGL